MTLKEFLKHLLEVKNKRNVKHYIENKYGAVCPITCVCMKLTHAHFKPYDYHKAAKKIGLNENIVYSIARAADIATSSTRIMRNKLLKAVGLPKGK